MRLRDIDLGPVLGASGVQGFFGEGYSFHRYMRPFGLDFTGMTFVAKTATLEPRRGNMTLDEAYRPAKAVPECIVVKPLSGVVLNAVGLSGPGAAALLADGRWQQRRAPFMLSFMGVHATKTRRLKEVRGFVGLLAKAMRETPFSAPFGLQLNFSCPNASVHYCEIGEEVRETLDIASSLDVPLMPKFNVLMPVDIAQDIARHPACDALCVSNTLPWGQCRGRVDWWRIFRADISPLARYGGGGLSGAPLHPLVVDWVARARRRGIRVPINAGGGILRARDAMALFDAGADSIAIGSMAILRGWRVRSTIRKAAAHAAKRRG